MAQVLNMQRRDDALPPRCTRNAHLLLICFGGLQFRVVTTLSRATTGRGRRG